MMTKKKIHKTRAELLHDEDFTYKSIDLYVNAWMPLPQPWKGE